MLRRCLPALLCALVLVLGLVPLGCRDGGRGAEVVVGAAASLRRALPPLGDAFVTAHPHPGVRVTASYGSSGDIVKQVEGGAGLDLVILAAAAPVDRLVQEELIDPATRRVVATNELVLIGTPGGPRLTFATLGCLPAGERLAIGDPASVPAGTYAREALEKLGLWSKLEGRLLLGTNVAAVLTYVQRGEVPLAIVYRTEVEGVDKIVLLDTARGEWAPRPLLVAGVVKAAHAPAQARALLDFMLAPEGRKIFGQFGFGPPP
jgi:molybdate transport system substrate-binding protein